MFKALCETLSEGNKDKTCKYKSHLSSNLSCSFPYMIPFDIDSISESEQAR